MSQKDEQSHGPERQGYVCVPEDVCFQPQNLYGTYVTVPPVFCLVISGDNTKKRHQHDSYHSEEEEFPDSDEEYLRKPKVKDTRPLKKGTKPKPNKCIDRRVGLKVGSFSFPARNNFYYPRQTLEDTVLELYKKESYPARRLD